MADIHGIYFWDLSSPCEVGAIDVLSRTMYTREDAKGSADSLRLEENVDDKKSNGGMQDLRAQLTGDRKLKAHMMSLVVLVLYHALKCIHRVHQVAALVYQLWSKCSKALILSPSMSPKDFSNSFSKHTATRSKYFSALLSALLSAL
ncbi:hypothetical protein OOU_Y34scaffold00834g3 [Pyricularia oryzae Y34]|uniref:Uncharacterized protein n=2 Tax=Pyricularia oryzae TaxID=318829 RepID=A0AA97PGR7_PYRO3|nr:hypothetical protein OOU_Y34scaffold00834g3 [Pyricularia oryzae Y34]